MSIQGRNFDLRSVQRRLMNRRELGPILALLTILIINWLISPQFISIRIVEGRLYGSLIDILNRGTPVLLMSIGMSLVIATKGIDLSVGAVMAIGGAVAAALITTTDLSPYMVILLSIVAGVACGLWNGVLVALLGIQPIIATLILMVTGRGIAQMISKGQIITFHNETLEFVGSGVLLGIPFPIYIAFFTFVAVYVLVRRTAIGVMIESVGANDRASYYMGINAALIKILAYVISGICAALAGLILTADIKGADSNRIGLFRELDAILAVVLGGASLSGGRFFLGLSVIGALIIQSIYTGILLSGLQPELNLIVKALVILAVLMLQSPIFRQLLLKPIKAAMNLRRNA